MIFRPFQNYIINVLSSMTHKLKFEVTSICLGEMTIWQHIQKNPTFPKYRKKNLNIRIILYNWATADQMEMGFSLNNRPKQAENMSVTLKVR